MTMMLLLLAASALWGCTRALSEDAFTTESAASIVEQYCFPKSGGQFSVDSVWPSVTMMYSGITLTTASLTFTASEVGPSLTTGLSTQSLSGPANSSAFSNATNALPLPEATETRAESAVGSPGPNNTPGVQSLAIAASPLHAATQRFYTAPPSVYGLALDVRCRTIDEIGQFPTK